jgi:uncharacterized protein YukE
MNGCEYMADKIEMQTEVMGEMVTNFRNVCRQIDDVKQEMIRLAIELEESFVSECSLPIQSDIYYIISTAKKLSDWSYSLSSKLNKAKNAFINADNQGSTLFRGDDSSSTSNKKDTNSEPSLIDEVLGSAITAGVGGAIDNPTSLNGELFYNEFLAKCARDDYKTDEKKYDVGGWQSFWDDTTPLSDYMIFGHKVPVISSSSDIVDCGLKTLFANNDLFKSDLFDGVISSSALSFLGTVVGHTDSIQKKSAGEVDENGVITNIYGDNISATYAPYTRVAKISGNIANTMSIGFMCADIGNTWTADSGNTRLQRVEKTVIQGVGDGICYETGKGSEAMAVAGFATLPDGGGALVITAGAIDVTVSTGVNYVEDKTYNWLGIK